MAIPLGRHALIVHDVFSRYLWARKMDGQAAVVEPMKDIMRVRRPKILFTDADAAFRSKAFMNAMQDLGVDLRIKLGRNDIATVDREVCPCASEAWHESHRRRRSEEHRVSAVR